MDTPFEGFLFQYHRISNVDGSKGALDFLGG